MLIGVPAETAAGETRVALTPETAKKLVKVEYEVLPAVHSPQEAAAPDAPLVFEGDENNVQAYKHVSRGDADGAIKNAKYVLTQHFLQCGDVIKKLYDKNYEDVF